MTSRIAPKVDHEVAEAVDDGCVLAEIRRAMHVSDRPDPLTYPIEVAEFLFQRGQYRQSRETRRFITLLDGQIAADKTLHEWRRAVEGPMTGDIGEAVMHLDKLEVEGVARRGRHWCRKRQAKLVQTLFDSTHESILSLPAQSLNGSQEGSRSAARRLR